MSNLVIPAVGALIGGYFGGPTGASIGWALGSAASAKDTVIEQPKVGDLRIQTSQYGTAIPFVIGTQRLSGNIIWAANKTEYTTETKAGKGGGGGTVTVSTGYKQSMLIAICKGPILGVRKVWADGKLIIDCTSGSKPLIGQLYLGDDSQMPDPTYASHVGADAPAYRGVAYFSLTDFDLGITGRVPQFSFEVVGGTI